MTTVSMRGRAWRAESGSGRSCCSGARCESHGWLVTAPQIRPRHMSVDRVPWGVRHVKENGSWVTACGRSAASWHVFWGAGFDPVDEEACPACARVVRAMAVGPDGRGEGRMSRRP